MDLFLAVLPQLLVMGVTYGSVYALIAIGFTIIYNSTDIVNFAQGEFAMLGAMTAYVLASPAAVNQASVYLIGFEIMSGPLPLWAVLSGAVAAVAALAALFERLTIHPLKAPSVIRLIIITIGASIFFKGIVMIISRREAMTLKPFSGSNPIKLDFASLAPSALKLMGAIVVAYFILDALCSRILEKMDSGPGAAGPGGNFSRVNRRRRISFLTYMIMGALGTGLAVIGEGRLEFIAHLRLPLTFSIMGFSLLGLLIAQEIFFLAQVWRSGNQKLASGSALPLDLVFGALGLVSGISFCPSLTMVSAYLHPQYLWVMGSTLVAVLVLHQFFSRTVTGKALRACAYNPRASSLMGINVRRMVLYTFILSGALGALAGITISPICHAEYRMGEFFGLKGFCAAILGGMGSIYGAVLGGLLIGVLESVGSYVSSGYKDAFAFVVMLIVLFLRPRGLLGEAGEERA